MMEEISEQIIKKGILLKRQRGLGLHFWSSKKFQERCCVLSKKSLCYYDGDKKKGSFEVDRIKIVEMVPPETFIKDFCIQVGDDAEVLYFLAKSKAEMEEWIHAFREAASNNDNVMLPRYHTGAYGLLSHGKWSCCNQAQRQTKGCKQAFAYQVNRSHTLQAQGTKNTAATELATQCRPTSFPCCLSNYPPLALPQCETLPPFPEGFRARCHSSITKSKSPKMSPLFEDLHKCATISTMRPSNERHSMVKLGRQHYENNSVPSIADSGTGESLQKLPKSTESLVSASSSRMSDAYILQSPEIEQQALEDIQMNTEAGKGPETKKVMENQVKVFFCKAAPNETPQDRKPHFLEQVKLDEKSLLTRIQQLEFNSDGGTYHSPEDGYSLTVPKGAIPENMGSVSVQCGVIPYGPLGPFKYPDGVKPVSPIVWFCSTPNVEFQKPVEIVIPHCLDCQSEEDTQRLAFFKANHDDYTASDSGEKMFDFKKAEGTTSFPLSTSSGTLCSKHFCFFCVGVYSKEDTAHANFCLITAKPVHIQRRCRIHFCLTYFLATCLKAVEEQFGADYDLTVKRRMKFQVTARGVNPSIKIKFERNLPGGWSIKRESMRKEICASEVYFWDKLPHELELMHEQKMYPPRFTLQVCGEKATHDATAVVEFEGTCEDLSTEIHLSLPTTEVQPYNHIGSSQFQALDLGMETSHFHGYPANGDLMNGPYTPEHFAVPRSSAYGNGYSFNVTPPTLSWGGVNSPAMLQSSPQCFPNMYPTFQPGQMLPNMWSHEPPSDVDIEEVTKEVMGKLHDDWVILQSYLGIPEHVMYQLEHEKCERNKIRAMLKEWRNMSSSSSRAELAECLQKADPRLHHAVELLVPLPDHVCSNGHLDN